MRDYLPAFIPRSYLCGFYHNPKDFRILDRKTRLASGHHDDKLRGNSAGVKKDR
jgi:hypothetical protein